MKLRVSLIVLSCALVLYCGASLVAAPEAVYVCCAGPDECDAAGGGQCCDTAAIGMLPCSPEASGICLSVCVKPGGGGPGQ